MSFLIKGMEMPTNCFDCPCCNGENGFCRLRKEYVYVDVPRSCPLILVPEHGRLIDADALEQDAQKRLLMCNKNDNNFQKPYEAMRAIALAPTIIPADKEGEG